MRCLVLWVSGIFLVALSVGCSSLNSGVSSSGISSPIISSAPSALKGVFVDGPVGGVNYFTPTLKGVTKADGVFEYQAGETVTFSIGGLTLGSTAGRPVITPLDLFPDAKGTSDQRVVNVSVFLQTLDQDGNPANGIMITENVASFVNRFGTKTDFNKPIYKFSFDSGFRALMAELNNIDAFGPVPRAVKPPFQARKHLESTLADLKKMNTGHQ